MKEFCTKLHMNEKSFQAEETPNQAPKEKVKEYCIAKRRILLWHEELLDVTTEDVPSAYFETTLINQLIFENKGQALG